MQFCQFQGIQVKHVYSKSLHFCCWNRSYAKTTPRHIINSKNYSWILRHGHHMTSYYVWCVFQLMETSLLALPTSIGGSICLAGRDGQPTVTRLLAIVVWFSLGWMAFWILPLLWPAFKAAFRGGRNGVLGVWHVERMTLRLSDKNQNAKGFYGIDWWCYIYILYRIWHDVQVGDMSTRLFLSAVSLSICSLFQLKGVWVETVRCSLAVCILGL